MTTEVQFLTPHDVAVRWQKRVQWVREHAAELGGAKIGNEWRFAPDAIERYETRGARRDPMAPTPLSAKRQSARGKRS